MTLLCWNLAGRVKRQPEQATLIAELEPDVVCLQEVTPTTARAWTTSLEAAGLDHVAVPKPDPGKPTDRRLSVLTAARVPLSTIDIDDLPWPERVLATELDGLELVNVHSPISPKPNLASTGKTRARNPAPTGKKASKPAAPAAVASKSPRTTNEM